MELVKHRLDPLLLAMLTATALLKNSIKIFYRFHSTLLDIHQIALIERFHSKELFFTKLVQVI
jgi:hypothetical protein